MAAKLSGLSTVSYGIGVQNRYSAFLDDEEGYISPSKTSAPKSSASNKRIDNNLAKQKSQSSSTKLTSNNASNNSSKNLAHNSSGTNQRNTKIVKQDQTSENKSPSLVNDGKRQKAGKDQQHQQQQQQGSGLNKKFGRSGNFANEQKTSINSNHQSNSSQSNGKDDHENHQQHGPKYARNSFNNGMPVRNRQRNSYHDNDTKRNEPLGDANGFSSNGHQSSEEEKRRRQQKRFLDLKHKDPEKREARQQRQQLSIADGSATNVSGSPEQSQRDSKASFRGPRQNSGANFGRTDDSKMPSGLSRGRGRRFDQGRDATGSHLEGQVLASAQSNGRNGNTQQPRNNRMPRNRNGLGSGSRGTRGPRGEGEQGRGRDTENLKPIPNFSDKSDFPSLAS